MNMVKVALKSVQNWQEDVWLMQKEMQVGKITNLDGPSIIIPDQSLKLLVSGMHQGYCRERCEALVKGWSQEFKLEPQEAKLLIDVIQNSNESWQSELGRKVKSKGSCKWRGTNWTLDDEDDIPGKSEVVHSASILSQPWQVGKRAIKLTAKATNANQDPA